MIVYRMPIKERKGGKTKPQAGGKKKLIRLFNEKISYNYEVEITFTPRKSQER